MDEATKDRCGRLLADTIERLQDAQKQLDREDTRAVGDYVGLAFDLMRELWDAVEFVDTDDGWAERWGRTWLHEATLFSAFADALSREPFLVEGGRRWRVLEVVKPPLAMPPDYKDNCKGPHGEIVVGTHTSEVLFTVTFDSTHDKHVRDDS